MALLRKYIGNDQISAEKILLDSNTAIRSKDSLGQVVELFKYDSSNILQFLKLPQVSIDPVAGNDLVRKSYLEGQVSAAKAELNLEIDAVEFRLAQEEIRAQAQEALIRQEFAAADEQISFAYQTADQAIITAYQTADQLIRDEVATKVSMTSANQPGGYAALDLSGKISTSVLPALAITSVSVVQTLAARDALVVQSGDVAKVIQGMLASDGTTYLPRSYIYDGTQWVELSTESDVDSVNGKVGHVVLTTQEIEPQGDRQYYTTAVATMIQGQIEAGDNLVRQEFAAADQQVIAGYMAADNVVRQEFAAADQQIISGYMAADNVVRQEFAAADDVVRQEFAFADQQIISGYQAADAQIRLDYAAADAATLASANMYTDGEILEHVTSKLGQPGGIATLDQNAKLYVSQLPALAITDVFVVTTLAERDALVVEEGDVAKVIQAELASDGVTYLPRTYIYAVDSSGSAWVEIHSESDVMSVAGRVGHVVLSTSDVSEAMNGPYYFTGARARAEAVVDSILGGEHDYAPSVFAAKAYIDQEITSARGYTDSQLDLLTIQQLGYEEFTADATIVSNGYIDLLATPAGIPWVMRQGVMGRPGIDFSVSNGRITFIGEWASTGMTLVEVGDKIHVWYMKSVQPYLM